MGNIISEVEGAVSRVLRSSGVKSVLVGISGGADSVALATALSRLGVRMACMHCNFRLRGAESERDREFVENLCRRNGWQLSVVTFDVEAYRREHGGSVEMACRDLRYAEFFKATGAGGFDRVAVAHNSDDNAETVLLNLFRGAGVAGLRGMRADTGEVIRPLLGVSRAQIEEYLGCLGQDFIIDSTNNESDYKRNFIRNEVLPLVETRWPAVRRALCRTASIMEEEERALSALEDSLVPDDQLLSFEDIGKAPDAAWLLRRFAIGKGALNDVAAEIVAAYASGNQLPGKHWNVGAGRLEFSSKGLEWIDGNCVDTCSLDSFEITQYTNTPALMKSIKEEKSNGTLWLGLDPADSSLFRLRPRRDGDRIHPLGMKGSRLVSDVISDSKLSAADRNRLCLLEYIPTGEIIWVEGLKRSRNLLITPDSPAVWSFRRKFRP